MMTQESDRQDLVSSIIRGRRFLRRWPFFRFKQRKDKAKLTNMPLNWLKVTADLTALLVTGHSNPLFNNIIKAALTGKMDPRWIPMVFKLRECAKLIDDLETRRDFEAIIDQTTRSDILLNLVRTTLWYISKSGQRPDTATYLGILQQFFDDAGCLDLLNRSPMAFTMGEGVVIKALTQCFVNPPEPAEFKKMIEGMPMARQMWGEAVEAIPYSKNIRRVIGDEKAFSEISLIQYGEHFVRVICEADGART